MERLLLFDIDGTLLRANRAGREMLGESLQVVYGTAGAIDTFDFAGRTDRGMIMDLLQGAGLDSVTIEAQLPELYEEMNRQGRRLFNSDRIKACEGVPELLAALQQKSDVLLGLLTGNIADTALLKLHAAGINPMTFRIGAFGSDSVERNELLLIAWQRARETTGIMFSGANTTIIGDTPADIVCAQNGLARSVAVATGWHTRDRLFQYGPDHLFDDLSHTDTVLGVLLA
ncbi:MAG: HAD hydrolase-like protein [Chloroflexota bacterium]